MLALLLLCDVFCDGGGKITQPDKAVSGSVEYPGSNTNRLQNNPFIFFPKIDFDKPITLIIALNVIIVYSIVSMFVILVFLLVDRSRRVQVEQKTNILHEQYQDLLVKYLEQKSDSGKLFNQLQRIANSGFTRKILITQMIDLSINLKGEAAAKLKSLYFMFGLNNDSLNKLRALKWHIRIKGYRECSFMEIKESKPYIEKGLHSMNRIVRSEAQLALVQLNTHDPYGFLDKLKTPFSVWEQNLVHEAITYHNLEIPEFERWLFSENNTIVMFAVKMIRLFDQKKSWKKLLMLLGNNNEKIRSATYNTLGSLLIPETQLPLKNAFNNEPNNNKIQIIKALKNYKALNNLVFFNYVLEHETDVWVQVEAAKGIQDIDTVGDAELEGILNSEDYRDYQIIIKHVLDKRL